MSQNRAHGMRHDPLAPPSQDDDEPSTRPPAGIVPPAAREGDRYVMRTLFKSWPKGCRASRGVTLVATTLGVSLLAAPAARAGTVLISDTGPGGHHYEVVSDTKISWDKAAAAA